MTRALIVFALAACAQSNAVPCADGRLCPPGTTCDNVNHKCIPAGCNDGQKTAFEECDTVAPDTVDCTDYGYYDQAGLTCNTVCEIDASTCLGGRCEDHEINGTEICDGIPPAAQTCLDYGFDIGRLECPGCIPDLSSCAGIAWRKMAGGSGAELSAIWGSSDASVFAVGVGGVILHSDGGAWSAMASGTTANLNAVWGSGPDDVYAVGDQTILHYDGMAWTETAVPERLNGVWGSAANDVIAVGTGGTIRRWNGVSWTTTTPVTEDLRAVWGRSASDVFVVGAKAKILRWSGATWSTMPAPTIPPPVRDLHAVWGTADRVFAVGGGTTGSVVSTNGVILELSGTDWTLVRTISSAALYSVWGSSSSDVWFGGFAGALFHYDGGAVQTQDSSVLRSLLGLWGTGASRVLAVTQGGSVHEYRGLGYYIEQLPASALVAIRELAGGEVVTVGYQRDAANLKRGKLYTFRGAAWDAGISTATDGDLFALWGTTVTDLFVAAEYIPPPATTEPGFARIVGTTATHLLDGHFRGVWGTASNDVWCVGLVGTTCHFNGSVATETAPTDSCPACPDLNAIWGSGPGDIFAVGHLNQTGAIRHHDGSGWSAMVAPPTGRLNAVWGTGPANVFAVGNSGALLHYDGASWTAMSSGTGENLLSVHGTGPEDVFVTGTSGTVLHYDGATWMQLRLPTTDVIYGVWAGLSRAWLATLTGKVIRIDRARAQSELRCNDGWDDDQNGFLDCADSACANTTACDRGGRCVRAADLACGDVVAGTTYSGITRIDNVDCLNTPHLGPETSYRFVASTSGPVTVTLVERGIDLEVAVLGVYDTGGCDPRTCQGTSTGAAATFSAVAGEAYYIVIDGPRDLAGTFTVAIDCP